MARARPPSPAPPWPPALGEQVLLLARMTSVSHAASAYPLCLGHALTLLERAGACGAKRQSCDARSSGAVAFLRRKSSAGRDADRGEILPLACMYLAAYSKSKSRKDHAPPEPLERPPYRRRRSGTSLGHLKHWVSRVRAAAAPPGPRRYASVIFAFKLDPLVSDLRSQSQKSEGQTSACRIDDMGNSD